MRICRSSSSSSWSSCSSGRAHSRRDARYRVVRRYVAPLLLLLLASCRRSEAPGTAPDALPPLTLDAAPATPPADAADAPAAAAAQEEEAPGDPREELTSRTYDVLLEGSTVYRGTTAGVVIEDVTEPEKPKRLGVAFLPGSVNDLEWIGKFERAVATACPSLPDGGSGCPAPPPMLLLVAAAGPEGVFLIDVTDPAQPRQVSRFDTAGAAMHVAVAFPLLFVADGTNGVVAIDAADPEHPALAGAWNGDWPAAMNLARPCALLPADGGGRCAPAAPEPTESVYARDVELVSGRLWVAAGAAGVVAVDIGNWQRVAGPLALSPRLVVDTPGDARAVAVDGNRLYVADGPGGFHIVDLGLGDPQGRASILATYPTGDICRDVKINMAQDKSLFPPAAYLAVGDRGLEIVDIAHGDTPMKLGAHVPQRPVNRVTVGPNGLLLLANDAAGLMIVDAADPGAIRQIFPAAR